MHAERDDDLDRPIWGAEAIGRFVGENNARKAFYLCQILLREGVITKVGRKLAGTPRNLRSRFASKVAELTSLPDVDAA
jgi:hypothetical protein